MTQLFMDGPLIEKSFSGAEYRGRFNLGNRACARRSCHRPIRLLSFKALSQIDHAHHHGAARVEGQVLKSPSRVEAAHAIIERMRNDAHAADDFGRAQRRLEGEQQEGYGVPLSLIVLVHRELTEKYDRHRVRAVALLRLREERALYLRSAQGNVADDTSRRGVGDDVYT